MNALNVAGHFLPVKRLGYRNTSQLSDAASTHLPAVCGRERSQEDLQ